MKKFFSLSFLTLFIFALAFSFTGCGEKQNTSGNDYTPDNITNETKVKNLSESYGKYTELKTQMLDKISENASNSDGGLALSMSMLGLTMVDLVALPATVCGLDETGVKAGLGFFYKDVTYDAEGNNYTITYKDSEGNEQKFLAEYDPKADSAKINIYEKDDLIFTLEYIKTEKGYASQYYAKDDDETFTTSKTIFDDVNISVGIYEKQTTAPDSIYKGNVTFADDWAKGGDVYVEIKDGVTKSVFGGQEVSN